MSWRLRRLLRLLLRPSITSTSSRRPVAHASACSGELQFAALVAERHGRRLPAEAGSGTLKRAPQGRKLFKDLAGRCTDKGYGCFFSGGGSVGLRRVGTFFFGVAASFFSAAFFSSSSLGVIASSRSAFSFFSLASTVAARSFVSSCARSALSWVVSIAWVSANW